MARGTRTPITPTFRSLKGLRVETGLNQTHFGLRAGLGLKRYWQIERGEGRAPDAGEKAAITKVLRKAKVLADSEEVTWPDLVRDVIRPVSRPKRRPAPDTELSPSEA